MQCRRAFLLLLECGAGIAVAIAVAGCLEDSRGSSGAALADPEGAAGAVPALATILTAVQPDEVQAPVLSEALADLEERAATLAAERETRRRHDSDEVGPPPPHETLDPMDSFLSAVVPVLRPEQVESLVDVLVAWREERRASRRDDGPRFDRSGHLARMAAELELTDDQRTRIAALLEESRDEIVAKRHADTEGGPLPGPDAADDSLRERIGAILTDAQRTKLHARAAERREALAAGRAALEAGSLDRRVSLLARALSLDPATEAAVRSAMERSAREREALFAARGEGPDREAMRSSMTASRARTQEAIAALLAPDQARVFAALGRLPPGGSR